MKSFLFLLLLECVSTEHDYFEYEDCGIACTIQQSSCTITEETPGKFITRCCNGEDCVAQESNRVVCLRPGSAPLGGSDVWQDFKRIVYPGNSTPTPLTCSKWQILLAGTWLVNVILVMIGIFKFIRSRRENPEQLINQESPEDN